MGGPRLPKDYPVEVGVRAINTAEPLNAECLQAIGFSGTVEDYLRGVMWAGRPVPGEAADYPQRMPTWGQRYGGPLRNDQVDALAGFIMNWEARVLAEAEAAPTQPVQEVVGVHITLGCRRAFRGAGRRWPKAAWAALACHIPSAVGRAWPPEAGTSGTREDCHYRRARGCR
jgi:hypothetical protein